MYNLQMSNLSGQNKQYWQKYKPGEIPSVPQNPPESLLKTVTGPVLDVGAGDGALSEYLVGKGFEVFAIDVAENVIAENMKRKSKVKYSVCDITKKSKFPDKHFGLIIFKFVLTNIHRDSWKGLSKELYRILKPGGKVWVLEPLVSDSYQERYALAEKILQDKNCVYVFKDKNMAEKIKTEQKLKEAISAREVSRIVKHYTISELEGIFKPLKLENSREITLYSPSGFEIKTFEGIFSLAQSSQLQSSNS